MMMADWKKLLLLLFLKWIILLNMFDFSLEHGRLLEPPSRNAMWRLGYKTKVNYEDHELFCGGYDAQWNRNKGRCGICGDSYSLRPPRPYEAGGKYVSNLKVRRYRSGSKMKIIIQITANHMGTFQFGLCNRTSFEEKETEKCFIPLPVYQSGNWVAKYKVKQKGVGKFKLTIKLPKDISCNYCTFRWHWSGANNWGMCPDKRGRVGCGPQETFRNCADIEIVPETTKTKTTTTTTTTTSTTTPNPPKLPIATTIATDFMELSNATIITKNSTESSDTTATVATELYNITNTITEINNKQSDENEIES